MGSYLLYSVGGRLLYFVAVYTNPGTSGVVTQLPFMTTIDPTTGTVGMSTTSSVSSLSASAYNDLIGLNAPPSNVTAANNVALLHSGIASLVSKDNDVLVNATTVSAPVQIRADTIPLSTLGVNQTVARVAAFLQTYGPKASGNTVYEWVDGEGNLDIGIYIAGQPIATLEYIVLTL